MKLKGQEVDLPVDGIVVLPSTEFRGPLEITSSSTKDMNPVVKSEVDAAASSIKLSDIDHGTLPISKIGQFTGDLLKDPSGKYIYLMDRGFDINDWHCAVSVLKYGVAWEASSLSPSDIPTLDWDKVSGTGNSLSSYGILDGVGITGGLVVGNLRNPSHPTEPNDVVTKKYLEDNLGNVSSTVDTGDILKHISENTPDGYLRTNGALVPIDEYPELYSVIGTGYTTTTFGRGEPWRWLHGLRHSSSILTIAEGMEVLPDIPTSSGRFAGLIVTKNKIYLFRTGISYPLILHLGPDGDIIYYEEGEHLDPISTKNNFLVTHNRAYMMDIRISILSPLYSAPIDEDGYLGEWVEHSTGLTPINSHNSLYFLTMSTKDNFVIHAGNTYVSTIDSEGFPSEFTLVYSDTTPLTGSQYVWVWGLNELYIGSSQYRNYYNDNLYYRVFEVDEGTGGLTVRLSGSDSYTSTHTASCPIALYLTDRYVGYIYLNSLVDNYLYLNYTVNNSRPEFRRNYQMISTDFSPKGTNNGQCVAGNYIYSFLNKSASAIGVQRYPIIGGDSDYSDHYTGKLNQIGETLFQLPSILSDMNIYTYIKT